MRNRNDLPFPMFEYERRLGELRQRMEAHDLAAMLVTTPENICYLTGFDSVGHYYFNCVVVPAQGEPFAVPRRLENSGMQLLTWIEVSRPYDDSSDPMDVLAQALEEFGLHTGRLGYEKDCWFFTASLQERLFQKLPRATFVNCAGLVEQGRLIKSDLEIELMRRVAATTAAGVQAGIDATCAGASENDVAAEVHYAMIKAGSEWPAISPFIASGPRGYIGHATWAGRVIEPEEFVFLEISGAIKRYHAPMMRTVYVGIPPQAVLDGEKVVLEAFDACMEAIKPGVPAGDIDALSRRIIGNSSFGAEQASRTAYSVGIGLPPDWGEGQILSMQLGETRPLQANMTFHLLPWVQIPGKGSLGITETVRVTPTGCERITTFERRLFAK
ncbi:MAG: aminopeptidase P family protein [Anaerolineaceae bacterium]|nr:aminopeptidase P family protein [Anaerolineaceae bacterium]